MINFWKNKKVLITGDTGFKGSWLTCCLLNYESLVKGIALKPDSTNVLYNSLIEDSNFKENIDKNLYTHDDIDIRRSDELKDAILEFNPDVIFHLAAQPLVRESYSNPKLTWETNVIGSINLLESLRSLKNCSVIIVTTDKVYENISKINGFKEDDKLGGHDPYSSSKTAVELATKSWRKSFFGNNIKIATVRAGNVIGGGDWAKDRIVPDTIRSLIKSAPLKLRYPEAVRPWQHVLDPLWGYMTLAEKQMNKQTSFEYNFGPKLDDILSVQELVYLISVYWGNDLEIEILGNQPSESKYLALSINKAQKELNWSPKWDIRKTLYQTVKWYKDVNNGNSPYECIKENINSFLLE
ncbi:CDP-glucose 4,6-dehydratase [Prochlorococcus marinus]|uniref:CDP-glucose 4,6-dehydratase n=1 Tax=Prochlorococcus marinus TaxID=1219 RepID=UPI001AD9D355|nr:CDP-glucose 4,6-dehydratase [Prochlorococcus marinus]MBO8217706.1 CDP-glucose 4,6-dehydratase [Prochlorococcus marinus XMU1405]MBW3040869.1 CDP-glucose 4,6-dehydratase [Prochlorococcus marinus str. MU1405]MBW3048329.1 CDP-glucose 4,6-dehydratase [Prochlorococcus marinus str. MU1406]